MVINISLSQPDPFEHGQASIHQALLEGEGLAYIQGLVKIYWGKEVTAAYTLLRNTANCETFFIDSPDSKWVLQSYPLSKLETLNTNLLCEDFAAQNGLPVPELVRSLKQEALVIVNNRIYVLKSRIMGTHFSGSRRELASAAAMLARFHKLFLNIPHKEHIISSKGQVYSFSDQRLAGIENTILNLSEKLSYDRLALEFITAIHKLNPFFTPPPEELPWCVGHFDWTPHNLIFDSDHKVIGILDFDLLRVGVRIADVALAMHKCGRVFGVSTEQKNDCGSNLLDRCEFFLNCYRECNSLSQDEIAYVPYYLFDQIRKKALFILEKHYLRSDDSSDFDLKKQYVQLLEVNEIQKRMNDILSKESL